MIMDETKTLPEPSPTLFAGIRGSLALRWVLLVTLVAGLGLALIVRAVSVAQENKIEAETRRLTEIAEQKMAERINIEIRLAERALRQLIQRYDQEAQSIARQSEILRLIGERDEQRTAERLGQALRRVGFDGGMLLDMGLAVLGGDRPELRIAPAEATLRQLDLFEALQGLVLSNDRETPSRLRRVGPVDPGMAKLFQLPIQGRYGFLIAAPAFDSFGDVAGVLLAYRLLGRQEITLDDFSRTIRGGVAMFSGESLISAAGNVPDIVPKTGDSASLQHLPAGDLVYRCAPGLPLTELCIFRSDNDVHQFREELRAVSGAELSRMESQLALLATAIALAIGVVILILTRRLTGPLTDLSRAVSQVAHGDFTIAIPHAGRADEIGQIGSALTRMQIALLERDRMRQEMARIDAINQRRLQMGDAFGRFENGIASVMQKISAAGYALTRAGQAMDEAARSTASHAERIHAKTIATATEASTLTGATLVLSQGLDEIEQRLRAARSMVDLGEESARMTGQDVQSIQELAREAEAALAAIRQQSGDLTRAALRASIRAMDQGESGREFLAAQNHLARLTEDATEAAGRIADAITKVTDVADNAAARLQSMTSHLGQAARETSEMFVVMAEQDAARRSLGDGLAGASQAMADLNEAVEDLRESLGLAQRATDDVISTARRIFSDAQEIDQSLRSFLREVVA
jgi:methyl-accepting chemotaxis protein